MILTTAFFVLALVAGPMALRAQQIAVSPVSVPLWGRAPHTSKLAVSYHDVELVVLYAFCNGITDLQGAPYEGLFYGLFWTPINIDLWRFRLEGGAGYMTKYPTKNGTHLLFTAKVTYRINDWLGARYSHISNGFGLLNELNPGLDAISLVYRF